MGARTNLRPDECLTLKPAREANPCDVLEAVKWLRFALSRDHALPDDEEFAEAVGGAFEMFEAEARLAFSAWLENDPDAIDTSISAMRREHGTWRAA